MNDIEKIKSLAKAVQAATTKQEKSIAISDLHDSLNSQVVLDILDRLEAAESEVIEEARLNGIGSEREAALMAKLEAAEKSDAESIAMYRKARDERDALRAETKNLREGLKRMCLDEDAVAKEAKAMQAKIEAMEQQRPVATIAGVDEYGPMLTWNKHWLDLGVGADLYALPVAQPAPSVPSIEAELLRQNVLELVNQYGDERAIEAYNGDLHCRKAPKDVFAEIERALETLSV